MSLSDKEQLARWRQIGARHSEEVLELAPKVLRAGAAGEDEWAVREQLAFAALDMGMVQWASEQIRSLEKQFPDSPRVGILAGLRFEALGQDDEARRVYEGLLEREETNTSAHQRLIALSLSQGPSTTIPLLLTYLDTYYTDAAAWSLLADLYCDLGLYSQGLTALGHVMVNQVWDSGAVSRAGAVAYTIGDHQVALKYYLRAIEMATPPKGTAAEGSVRTRDWWSVRQCTKRLLDDTSGPAASSLPPEMMIGPVKLRALNQLATERILDAGGSNPDVRRRVLGDSSSTR